MNPAWVLSLLLGTQRGVCTPPSPLAQALSIILALRKGSSPSVIPRAAPAHAQLPLLGEVPYDKTCDCHGRYCAEHLTDISSFNPHSLWRKVHYCHYFHFAGGETGTDRLSYLPSYLYCATLLSCLSLLTLSDGLSIWRNHSWTLGSWSGRLRALGVRPHAGGPWPRPQAAAGPDRKQVGGALVLRQILHMDALWVA